MLLSPSSGFAQISPPNTILRVDAKDGLTIAQGATGNDWVHAYKHLQDALDAAPDETPPVAIWVRGGNDVPWYRPDQGANVTPNARSATFSMIADVRLYGGFVGNEPGTNAGFQSRDPNANITVLTGEIGDPELITDNSWHVVTAIDSAPSAIIDGFTIRDGNAYGENVGYGDCIPNQAGGGLFILCNTQNDPIPSVFRPTVLRCVFTNNLARLGNWSVGSSCSNHIVGAV